MLLSLTPAFLFLLLRCRLDVYYCSTADATSAVSMLEQLPRLRGIKLGIHAYHGHEAIFKDYLKCYDVDGDERVTFPEWVRPPALAGLSALTELELAGAASLPPDWRQLSSLQRLRVMIDLRYWPHSWPHLVNNSGAEGRAACHQWCFKWGTAPLAALRALTRLEGNPQPGKGCCCQAQFAAMAMAFSN